MQRPRIKLLQWIFIAILTLCLSAPTSSLSATDSTKNIEDSLLTTLENLSQNGNFSEQNLKLAALKYQSTEQYKKEIITLHQLLLIKPNWDEIDFIEQKAKNQQLLGYEYDEWHRINLFVKQYTLPVAITAITLLVIGVFYAGYFLVIKKHSAGWVGLLIPIILVIAVLVNYQSFEKPEGYTHRETTLLFEKPSPSAPLKLEANFGERVRNLKIEGEWYKGQVGESHVYVRQQDLILFFK